MAEFFRDYVEALPGRAYIGGDYIGQARITLNVNEPTRLAEILPQEAINTAHCNCPQCRASLEEPYQAGQRARTLLLGFLTQEQQQVFSQQGYFRVTTERGTRYELHGTGVVYRVEGGDYRIAQFCVGMPGYPSEDSLLGIKLLLEENEAAFLRVANPYGMNPSVAIELELADARITNSLKEPDHYTRLTKYRADLGKPSYVRPRPRFMVEDADGHGPF